MSQKHISWEGPGRRNSYTDMKNEPCAYCGENKWENKEKHLNEASEFLAQAARMLGSLTSKKKAKAARKNGKLGGRPMKSPTTK